MRNTVTTTTHILPPDTLKGMRVGVSVSESTDLLRLGLTESHLRLALGEIARSVLVLGGGLAYGGHLDPDGYTSFLTKELRRFARRDRPLMICLAWPEHRRIRLSQLQAWQNELGLYGEVVYLSPDGESVDPAIDREESPVAEKDPEAMAHALTALRHFMGSQTHGRVLIGGKRARFQGRMPGLVEEAIIALEAHQPLFLVGGFGGVTLDIIHALQPDNASWMPPYAPVEAVDPRCEESLELMKDRTKAETWAGLNNGLTPDENRVLAVTHRPSEIASLVSLGLGRLTMGTTLDDD